jgi:hypothetical protein
VKRIHFVNMSAIERPCRLELEQHDNISFKKEMLFAILCRSGFFYG